MDWAKLEQAFFSNLMQSSVNFASFGAKGAALQVRLIDSYIPTVVESKIRSVIK